MGYSESKPMAIACMWGSGIRGTVLFLQKRCGVLIRARIENLPENGSGFYGFHIHEGMCCDGAEFAGTKGHWDAGENPHPRHAGDLPPLLSRKGSAYLEVITDRFSLEQVIGRTVVIHDSPDDFRSQPAGAAGKKIACGIIRKIGY